MKTKIFFLSLLSLLLFALSACVSSDPSIRINFVVPDSSEQFAGKTVSIKVEDQREDKNILGPAAFVKFDKFNGKFSFAHKSKDELLGIYDAPELFVEAIKTRLEKQGLKFVQPAENVPEIVIILKEFSLTYKEDWKAKITLDAQLNVNGKTLSTESITAEGERELAFKSTAEGLLSERVSIIVNRLNFERLFKKSNL